MTYVTHGAALKCRKLYRVWNTMKQRCFNPAHDMFHIYGGRGIGIAPEWLNPAAFVDWALSAGYREGLSIDRIDPDIGYEPSNCRFVTMKDQQRNRRNNTSIAFRGRTCTLAEIGEITGIPADRIGQRMRRSGCSVEDAVNGNIPRKTYVRASALLSCGGIERTAKEWALLAGVAPKTIYVRHQRGEPLSASSRKPWLTNRHPC